MPRPAEKPSPKSGRLGSPIDWPALSLFFLLATSFWIPPLPHSLWSLPAVMRILWLSLLLVASYIVLFRRRAPSR